MWVFRPDKHCAKQKSCWFDCVDVGFDFSVFVILNFLKSFSNSIKLRSPKFGDAFINQPVFKRFKFRCISSFKVTWIGRKSVQISNGLTHQLRFHFHCVWSFTSQLFLISYQSAGPSDLGTAPFRFVFQINDQFKIWIKMLKLICNFRDSEKL